MILPVASARAQDEASIPSTPPPPDSTLQVNLNVGSWLTRVNGDARLGPSPAATEIRLEEAFDLDSYQAIFNAELSVTKNDLWQLQFSGFDFAADATGTFGDAAVFGALSLDPGDAFSAEFEMTSIAAEFCAWVWQPYCIGPLADGRECRVALRAGPLVGARLIDIDHTVSISGEGTARAQGEWLAPYAGVQFELRFDTRDSLPALDSITIDAGGALGPALGGDGGTVSHIHAGLTAHLSPNLGVGFGYRLIQVDVQYDDFEFTGGLQGLFVFASLRF